MAVLYSPRKLNIFIIELHFSDITFNPKKKRYIVNNKTFLKNVALVVGNKSILFSLKMKNNECFPRVKNGVPTTNCKEFLRW